MEIKNYRDLAVWQKSMSAAKEIYFLVRKLPKEEIYAMSNQMRRAAISIPSNIAEGNGRTSTREYLQFLSIARGSLSELETQLMLCVSTNMLTNDDIAVAWSLLEEVGKMLNSMIMTLRSRI